MDQLKEGPIQPVRLGPDSRFTFRCHKDVNCFTQCCRGINIILTPYDIIRLKNRLGLSSEEFLAVYTDPQILEKTDIPVVTLRLLEAEGAEADGKPCPFVRPEGCLVYEDRPTSCRYYPLGEASLSYKDDPGGEEFWKPFISMLKSKGYDGVISIEHEDAPANGSRCATGSLFTGSGWAPDAAGPSKRCSHTKHLNRNEEREL